MSSSVDKIKERLSIVDVISSYLKLEKAGSNYKAVCPFHNEKTPSFFVSPSRNSYYCFGCGAKGDIFSFVEQFEALDFRGALNVLAKKAGIEIEEFRGNDDKGERKQKERIYELMEHACRFFENELSQNSEAMKYLTDRGVTRDTIKSFRIGYAKDEWRALSNEMKKLGFSENELVLAGLAKHKDDNKSLEAYDRFRDRVMFPIGDTSSRIIAFSGRILHAGDVNGAKYINSPETIIFKKGSTLYGLDKAKFEIRKKDQAILVEGQMDLVLSHQAGFTNTVASSGTALTDSTTADSEKGLLSGLGQVKALSNNLVIAYDGDKAGMKAAGRAEKIGLSLGMNVKIAKLPKDQDPADTILKGGENAWKQIIDSAEHIISFYLSVLSEHDLSTHTRMRAVRDKILPYVAAMPSAVERAHFIREIYQKTGIPEEALLEDVVRFRMQEDSQTRPMATEVKRIMEDRGSKIEDRVFGIIFYQESITEPHFDIEAVKKKVKEIISSDRYMLLYDIPIDKKNEKIFEVEVLYKNPEQMKKDVNELLLNLEEEVLSDRLAKVVADIARSEQRKDHENAMDLLKESQEITSRLNSIKSSRYKN